MPTRPKTLEVFTTTPLSCSTRIGRKARVPLTTPVKLLPNNQSWSSGTALSTLAAVATPALLKTPPSGAGIHRRTWSANSRCAAASLTSSAWVSTGPVRDAAVSFKPVSSMSLSATGQPCPDRRRARLRPMPEAAPLMTTVLPASFLRWDFGIHTPGSLRLLRRPPARRGLCDDVDHSWPGAGRQVVTHAGDGLQPCTRDRANRREPAARVHHPVAVTVHHDRRCLDAAALRAAITGGEDRRQLP